MGRRHARGCRHRGRRGADCNRRGRSSNKHPGRSWRNRTRTPRGRYAWSRRRHFRRRGITFRACLRRRLRRACSSAGGRGIEGSLPHASTAMPWRVCWRPRISHTHPRCHSVMPTQLGPGPPQLTPNPCPRGSPAHQRRRGGRSDPHLLAPHGAVRIHDVGSHTSFGMGVIDAVAA